MVRLYTSKRMTEAATQANRLNGLRGGRPRKATNLDRAVITQKCLDACPEAVETVIWEMKHSDNPMIRLHAAQTILDRGMGRPGHGNDRAAGQIMDMLTVITGVPRPEPEQIEPPIEIEGEILKEET